MARRRNGFTLLELVVCIFFIGLLLALFLPLNRGSRGFAVQAQCLNNMAGNLAKAHLQFDTRNNRFCGYVNSVGQDHKPVSWIVPLFPYIDRQDLANAWTVRDYEWPDANQTIPAKIKHPETYIELLVCPVNPPADFKHSPLGYVVNSGYSGDKQPACEDAACVSLLPGTGENLANGVFHDQYGPRKNEGFNPQFARSMTMQYLAQHDGASRTIMMSENVQLVKTWYTTAEDRAPLAMVWYQDARDTTDPTKETHRINWGKTLDAQGRLDYARPSSYHAQGVNVAFCDGHGKFISESINYNVYKQLMTTASELSSDQKPIELDESLF
jgi:prepilin-type processing-associated H-X9-DG protein